MSWLRKISGDASSEQVLRHLIPQFVAVAQEEYDQWDQSDEEFGDPEVGFGGICHLIAEKIAGVVMENTGFDTTTINNEGMGEQHVWVVTRTPDGVFSIDIPPCVYETGGGYTWEKLPDVRFGGCDVLVEMLSPDPHDFDQYER